MVSNYSSFQIAVAFSDWFSLLIGLPEVLGDQNNWPLAFALPGLPALALVCILPFCPESPKYTLGTKHDRDKALKDVELLIGKEQAPHMFESIVREVALDEVSFFCVYLYTRISLLGLYLNFGS